MANCNKNSDCGCTPRPSMHTAPAASCDSCSQPRPSMMRPSAGRPCAKPDPLGNMPVAMAYVPWQYFKEVYELDKALQYGTIFPELNKPFYGRGGCVK